MKIERTDGLSETVEVVLRIDTPVEVDYYRHGGILPYVLRGLLRKVRCKKPDKRGFRNLGPEVMKKLLKYLAYLPVIHKAAVAAAAVFVAHGACDGRKQGQGPHQKRTGRKTDPLGNPISG